MPPNCLKSIFVTRRRHRTEFEQETIRVSVVLFLIDENTKSIQNATSSHFSPIKGAGALTSRIVKSNIKGAKS